MNFLVTGGAGFIGSHVCERLLALGHAVWALDDLNPYYDVALKKRNLELLQSSNLPFTFVREDVANRPALDSLFSKVQFDQVLHMAARAGVRPSLKEPALYFRVNAEGTANILEAVRNHDVPKLIFASSSSVYGNGARVPFSEEDAVGHPISPYAASKVAAEALAHVYHQLHGIDVTILRFFTVYGPRQRPDLAIYKFAERISNGEPIQMYGDGNSARDYTYITDIVDGVMAAVEKNTGFDIFNLGESQIVPLTYLIQLLEKALGQKAIIEQHPLQPGDVSVTCANISKARIKLGYCPRVKIEEGIPKFVDWFRSSAQLRRVSSESGAVTLT